MPYQTAMLMASVKLFIHQTEVSDGAARCSVHAGRGRYHGGGIRADVSLDRRAYYRRRTRVGQHPGHSVRRGWQPYRRFVRTDDEEGSWDTSASYLPPVEWEAVKDETSSIK